MDVWGLCGCLCGGVVCDLGDLSRDEGVEFGGGGGVACGGLGSQEEFEEGWK